MLTPKSAYISTGTPMKRSAFKPRKPRPKKCPVCREHFTPTRGIQPTCHKIGCQQEYALAYIAKEKAKEAKSDRAKTRAEKLAGKPIKYWESRTQDTVNELRRAQDMVAGYGCITCGTHEADEWHGGHFIPRGVSNGARYEYNNIWLQCRSCNFFGGAGRKVMYETNLIGRVGQAEVDRIKAIPHKRIWTRGELELIYQKAKVELKMLKQNTPERG